MAFSLLGNGPENTGMLHIDDATIHDEPTVPFGGEKRSGPGRLNGEASLRAFTTEKLVSVTTRRRDLPI